MEDSDSELLDVGIGPQQNAKTLVCPRPPQKVLDMLYIPPGLIVSDNEEAETLELAFPTPEEKYIDYEYRLEVFTFLSVRGYQVKMVGSDNLCFRCSTDGCSYKNEFDMIRPDPNPESWTVQQKRKAEMCQHTCKNDLTWNNGSPMDSVIVQELGIAILTSFLREQDVSQRLDFQESYCLRRLMMDELKITFSEEMWNELIGLYYRMRMGERQVPFYEIWKDALIKNLYHTAEKKDAKKKQNQHNSCMSKMITLLKAFCVFAVGAVCVVLSVFFVFCGALLWRGVRSSAKREMLKRYTRDGVTIIGTIWPRGKAGFTITYKPPAMESDDASPEISKYLSKDENLGSLKYAQRLELLVLPGFPHSAYPARGVQAGSEASDVKTDLKSFLLAIVLAAFYYVFWWFLLEIPAGFFISIGMNCFAFVYREFAYLRWRKTLLFGGSI